MTMYTYIYIHTWHLAFVFFWTKTFHQHFSLAAEVLDDQTAIGSSVPGAGTSTQGSHANNAMHLVRDDRKEAGNHLNLCHKNDWYLSFGIQYMFLICFNVCVCVVCYLTKWKNMEKPCATTWWFPDFHIIPKPGALSMVMMLKYSERLLHLHVFSQTWRPQNKHAFFGIQRGHSRGVMKNTRNFAKDREGRMITSKPQSTSGPWPRTVARESSTPSKGQAAYS